jgi:oxygen-independent coproporphyrinogen-3 oxidase
MRQSARAGVYVHFPWCLNKCPYCDFVSYGVGPTGRDQVDHAGYARAVIQELERRAEADPRMPHRRFETVFFGGGTPSLWQPEELGRVLSRVRSVLDCAGAGGGAGPDELEVTVECNPTSLDEDRARALVDVGVNRLSIGVQSLRDERLRYLGRLHDARGGVEAVRAAKRAGVPRISADLIFGLPGQSPEEGRAEATELVDLGLDHVSCYQLTIEPGTRFGELAKRGRLPLADDSAVADAFLAIDEALTSPAPDRGFVHYEVSNYARPGQEARHNLGYWRGDEYLGLGCAAYGFLRTGQGEGVRYRNEVLPGGYMSRYMSRSMSGASTAADTTGETAEPLDGTTLLRERIMLGLRMAEGFDLETAAADLGVAGWTPERRRAAMWLEERGRLQRDGSRLRVPREAWLWTDDTAARLF